MEQVFCSMVKALLSAVGYPAIQDGINGRPSLLLISDIYMMSQMVINLQSDVDVGMYSFTGEFCHEHRFEVRWWRGIWFILWVLLAFLIYEAVRAILVWGWTWFMRQRQGRIRLPQDNDEVGL